MADPAGATQSPRQFTPGEIAAVLAHYELGAVTSLRELIGGGAGSPKALVECARGRFVLKRRAVGRDNPFRVAYTHEIMLHLRAQAYSAPMLIGTRDANNSMVQHDGRVYELFQFVEGRPFARRAGQAAAAGAALAGLHATLEGFTPTQPDPPVHPATHAAVRHALDLIRCSDGALMETLDRAEDRIAAGSDGPDRAGLIHGDFHPGNLLFRDDQVAGVFDFDSTRRGPIADDLAQGLVQFSMTRAGTSAVEWPAAPDLDLAGAFWRGSGAAGSEVMPPRCAGPRMARTLIDEWAHGVAGGLLGDRDAAGRILAAVARKSAWLVDHADRVAEALIGSEHRPKPA